MGDKVSKSQRGVDILSQSSWALVMMVILPRALFLPLWKGTSLYKIDVQRFWDRTLGEPFSTRNNTLLKVIVVNNHIAT